MEIGVIGLSHQNAMVETREKFAFTTSKKQHAMQTLAQRGVDEVVILSTCNRAEIYFAAPDVRLAAESIKAYCEEFFYSGISQFFYSYKKRDAISHLFRVACGLDSLVLGEDQILGQVKDAFAFAMKAGGSKKMLNQVFRACITFAKKAKTNYKMSENPMSISSIAVKYISQQIGGLSGKNVLVMGVGKIGKLILRYICEQADVNIYITKRAVNSSHKYRDIQQEFEGVKVINFESRYQHIKEMDVVFSATASPHVIVRAEALQQLKKPVIFMDVAVPRDVDIEIKNMVNVTYHDIDDLKAIADESEAYRRKIAQIIHEEIDKEVEKVEKWVVKAQVDETIHKLNIMCDKVYKDTWDIIDKKIDLSEKDAQNMQKIVKSCIRKVVKTPINQLKDIDSESDIERMKHAIEYLYDLEEA